MAEGLLLGNDGDVILARVGHQLRGLVGRKRAARRRGQRLVGIKQRVLEVGRIDVDLECGEDANLVLLEFQRGKRAARKIVVNAAVAHRRPVAHRARGQNARRARQRQQLLEGLHAVKDARARGADNGGFVRFDDQDVALRFHHRIERRACRGRAGPWLRRNPCAEASRDKAACAAPCAIRRRPARCCLMASSRSRAANSSSASWPGTATRSWPADRSVRPKCASRGAGSSLTWCIAPQQRCRQQANKGREAHDDAERSKEEDLRLANMLTAFS